jgi:DNA polymerase III subunit delta
MFPRDCIGTFTRREDRPLSPPVSPGRAVTGSSAPGGPPASGRTTRPAPTVYLLLGEEEWLAEDALQTLLRDLLPASERELNLDVADAAETPIQEVIARCDTFPFLGNRRIVVLRRGEALRPADQDALADYLDRGPPPSVLILVAEKLDRRRRLFTVLQGTARIIPCRRLDPQDLLHWIRARVAAAGKTIAPEAAEVLVVLVGGALRNLSTEIDKLVSYIGARRAITADDVRTVTSHVAESTVFELMDAVGLRQADRALRLLQVVLADEPAVRVLFMLGDQIRMLLRTKALQERNPLPGRRPPQDAIRAALGTRAFLYERYRAQVAAFGRMDVARILGMLMETDTEIKTGSKPPRLALETLIVGLCV